ncbi:MAG: hypothetical protein H3C58_01165 [Fimbriimonadaceae bacterium]|nr:hypothetical protein [Fimbriimonadaceae bacterium]
MRFRYGWLLVVAAVACATGCSGGSDADPYKDQPMPERSVNENVKNKGDAQ